MQINATSPIKMPPPYGGVPPIICKKPIDSNGHEEVTIQLCGVIEQTSQFLEVFEVLGRAKSGDEIRIVIDTPGGNVYATQLLVDYMARCKGNVTTVASGLVASAGTIVWFYGKNREVGPWAKFMFHGTSHGAFGRSSEIKEEATELVKFMESLLKDMVAAGILTNEEYTKITSCKQDTYITGEQMRKRLFAAMSATEAMHILSETGEGDGEGSGKGSGSDEGAGSGSGEGEGGKGSGSGSGKGDGEGDEATGKKKNQGDDGGSGDGEGSGSGEGSGDGEGSGEGEKKDPETTPQDKKKAEGSGEGDGKGEGEKGKGSGDGDDDDSEGEKGSGEKEHGDDCDCDECKSKRAKKSQKPGEGDGDGSGEGEDGAGGDDGDAEDSWAADAYFAKK